MDYLKRFLSQESFTEEEEIEAPEVVDELDLQVPPPQDVDETTVIAAAEDGAEADEVIAEEGEEIDMAAGATEQAQEEIPSVEHYISVLQHGLRTRQFSPQFAVTAQHKLHILRDRFGDDRTPVPSLESYNGRDDLEKYYQASLESFSGFKRRLQGAIGKAMNYIPDLLSNGKLVTGFKKKAGAVNTKLDALIGQAAEASFEGKVDVEGLGKSLSGLDGDVIAGLNADLKLLSAVVGRGLKANETFINGSVKILAEASQAGPDKASGILAKAAGLKPATDSYPPEAFEKGFLGGGKLVKTGAAPAGGESEEEPEVSETAPGETTEGSSEGGEGGEAAPAAAPINPTLAAKLKELAKTAIPGVTTAKGEAPASVSLDKKELERLLKLGKVYASLAEKSADNTGANTLQGMKRVADIRGQANASKSAGDWNVGKDVDALASALPRYMSNHTAVYRYAVNHALDMAEAITVIASKALKKAGTPAPAATEPPAGETAPGETA